MDIHADAVVEPFIIFIEETKLSDFETDRMPGEGEIEINNCD